MVFKPRQKRSICNIQISIDNQNIVKVKETNFLGVILDENLNWKSEISHVANKVAKSIGMISRCSFFLPKTSLRMLYYSLIYPYFYYCNIVWASTYKTNLRRLVVLQKCSLQCRRILGGRNLVRVRNIVVAAIFDFMTVEDRGE